MMVLIKRATTFARVECMEIQSQRVAYQNVQPHLQKQTTQIMERLLMENSVEKFAQDRSMPLQVPGNVSLLVQQGFTPIPNY
jgi:hypothetical protein